MAYNVPIICVRWGVTPPKIVNSTKLKNMPTDSQKHETPTDANNVLADSYFWVECNVCKTQLKNWTGSTPCCGSIAWMVEDGKPTKKLSLFASVGGEPIKPTIVDVGG